MKTRFTKLFGLPYYTKETRRFRWSGWKPEKNGIGQIIPYRYLGNGKYESYQVQAFNLKTT